MPMLANWLMLNKNDHENKGDVVLQKHFLGTKERAIEDITEMLNKYSGTKRGYLLSSWLSEYSRFIKQEETFKPQFLKRYKRGEIVKVNLGYKIGCEEGGPHYAIVLDKQNSIYSDNLLILPLSSKTETTKFNRYTLDLGNEIYEKLQEKYLQKFNECIKDVSAEFSEDQKTIKLSVKVDSSEADKVQEEIDSMKAGSIALISQITTISKIRIIKPKRTTEALSDICVCSETLDKIDKQIKELYIGK